MPLIQPLLSGEDLRKGMTVRICRADIAAPDHDQWCTILNEPTTIWRTVTEENPNAGPSEPKYETLRFRDVVFYVVYEDGTEQNLAYSIGVRWEQKPEEARHGDIEGFR